jgi:hypothetical protein
MSGYERGKKPKGNTERKGVRKEEKARKRVLRKSLSFTSSILRWEDKTKGIN